MNNAIQWRLNQICFWINLLRVPSCISEIPLLITTIWTMHSCCNQPKMEAGVLPSASIIWTAMAVTIFHWCGKGWKRIPPRVKTIPASGWVICLWSCYRDLNKIEIPTSISRWIRMNLCDTFRFIIALNERHMRQADRVLQQVEATSYM